MQYRIHKKCLIYYNILLNFLLCITTIESTIVWFKRAIASEPGDFPNAIALPIVYSFKVSIKFCNVLALSSSSVQSNTACALFHKYFASSFLLLYHELILPVTFATCC